MRLHYKFGSQQWREMLKMSIQYRDARLTQEAQRQGGEQVIPCVTRVSSVICTLVNNYCEQLPMRAPISTAVFPADIFGWFFRHPIYDGAGLPPVLGYGGVPVSALGSTQMDFRSPSCYTFCCNICGHRFGCTAVRQPPRSYM
jgi:hypothetical protein